MEVIPENRGFDLSFKVFELSGSKGLRVQDRNGVGLAEEQQEEERGGPEQEKNQSRCRSCWSLAPGPLHSYGNLTVEGMAER